MTKPKLTIGVMPCQSGKTSTLILPRIREGVGDGRPVILVLPSRIALITQTVARLTGIVSPEKIARWDTGDPYVKLDSVFAAVEQFKLGKKRLLIVLNNSSGIRRLVGFLSAYTSDTAYAPDPVIVVDEAHSLLNIDTIMSTEDTVRSINEMIGETLPEKQHLKMFTISELWVWILHTFPDVFGVTATPLPLLTNKIVSCIRSVSVESLKPPPCYIGFDQFEKKLYKDHLARDETVPFRHIVEHHTGKTVCMFHARREVATHWAYASMWEDVCRKQGKSCATVIDNGFGYTVYVNGKRTHKIRKSAGEPFVALKAAFRRADYILITGKLSMNMSNTYQCKDVFINHLVIPHWSVKKPTRMSSTIQEIGRMCCNDTNGVKRTLWVYDQDDLDVVQTSFKMQQSFTPQKETA